MLFVVLSAATLTSLAMVWAAESGWTSKGDTEFDAGAGALFGIGVASIPATSVGVYIAFGPKRLENRMIKGFLLLNVLPLAALVTIALTRLRRRVELREQFGLFAAFSALSTGAACTVVWSLVGLLRASVPVKAASRAGSAACLLVLLPCAGVVAMLTRNNAASFSSWRENAHEEGDTRPPVATGLCLAVIYNACVSAIVPALRLIALGETETAGLAAYFQRRPFTNASCVCLSCVITCFGVVAVPNSRSTTIRFSLAILLVLTPVTLFVSTTAVATSRDARTTTTVLSRGSRKFVLPVMGMAFLMLRATMTRNARVLWWRPACVATFCSAGVATLVMFAVAPLTNNTPKQRFEIAARLVAVSVFPWWLATILAAYSSYGEIEPLTAPALLLAGATSCFAILEALPEGRRMWMNSQETLASLPRRANVLWIGPHALLLFSIAYLALNAMMIELRVGGLGILLGSTIFGPVATYGGIRMLLERRSTREWCVVALPISVLTLLFFTHVAIQKKGLSEFFQFDEPAWSTELRVAALWLGVTMPLTLGGWKLVAFATSIWRRREGASGTAETCKEFSKLGDDYYTSLLSRTANLSTESVEPSLKARALDHRSLASILKKGVNISTIDGEETLPFFASLHCLVILVPFGVFAPLAFVAKFGALALTHRSIMAILGIAVIFGMGIVTYLGNSSLERIRREEQSKLATFELRLSLRKSARVVVSARIARLLHESRETHTHFLSRLAKNLYPKNIQADAADIALREELTQTKELVSQKLLKKRERYEKEKSKIVQQKQNDIVQPEGDDDIDTERDDAVFWKESSHEQGLMELVMMSDILTDAQHKYDRELASLSKEARRQAAKTSPRLLSPRREKDEELLESVIPTWLQRWFTLSPGCCCVSTFRVAHSTMPARKKDSSDEKARVIKVSPMEECDLEMKARKFVSEASILYNRLQLQARSTSRDDDIFGTSDVEAVVERVQQLRRKMVACARWRAVLESISRLVERKWVLTAPSTASTLAYRQSLLPRAFCHYASSASATIDKSGWLRFLQDSQLLEGEKYFSKHAISLQKANTIYENLPSSGVDSVRESSMTYSCFRQAMRQIAVFLYPQLPEVEALKLLGQKHVFPRVPLDSARRAFERGLMTEERKAPRLSDFLVLKIKSRHDVQKALIGLGQKQPKIHFAGLAGERYTARLDEIQERVTKALEALEAFGGHSVTKLSSATVAQILSSSVREDSPEVRAFEDLESRAAAEANPTEEHRFCDCSRLFTLAQPKSGLGDAQMELALLKAGAFTIEPGANDWQAVTDQVVLSLRQSADKYDSSSNEGRRQRVQVSLNIDNGFMVLELLSEMASFGTLALQGAGAYAWGLLESCELEAECPSDKTNSLAFITRAPLFLFNFDVIAQFWVVCAFCLLVPLYLLKAVKAARQQRIGQNADGSKLKLLSLGWMYFTSIKLLQSTVPPIMTTLMSALVCDTCSSRLNRMSTRCASFAHVVQLGAALVGTIAFYPAIAYIQPQLQFKSKALDLKFQPAYVVVLAFGKLILAGAVNFLSTERYAVNCFDKSAVNEVLRESFQLIVFAAIVAGFLAWYTWYTQPCLVPEFNTVRACTLLAAAACLCVSAATYALKRYLLGETARYLGVLLLLTCIGPIVYFASRATRKMLKASSLRSAKVEPEA